MWGFVFGHYIQFLIQYCEYYRPKSLIVKSLVAGTRYGPPGSKRLIYFADDCNMPLVDKYDTQSAIELMRQAVDYQGWYDKVTTGTFPCCQKLHS